MGNWLFGKLEGEFLRFLSVGPFVDPQAFRLAN